jgi:lipoprotein-releasing system permease protein
MSLIVIVAAVNVASAITMLVVERRKEIGILKSYGASPDDIQQIFIIAAGITGLLGAVIGIAIGLGIGYTINELIHGLEVVLSGISWLMHGEPVRLLNPTYYLQKIPIIINWSVIIGIGAGTVVCSLLVAVRSAHRAGRLSPVEILQKY